METLSGILSPASVSLEGTLAKVITEPYEGEYEVTPSAEEQTLLTGGKLLENDIVVNPIGLPFADVSGVTAFQVVVRSGYKFVDRNGQLLTGSYNPPADAWSRLLWKSTSSPTETLTILTDGTSQQNFELSASGSHLVGKLLLIRVIRGDSNRNPFGFIASDSLFIVSNSTGASGGVSEFPQAIITWKYGTSAGIKVFNAFTPTEIANFGGVYAGYISPAGSSLVHTIRMQWRYIGNKTSVRGAYYVYAYLMTYPTNIGLVPINLLS